MRITSTQNSVVKYLRSLERASVRREEGVFLAEGVRLLLDAVATHQIAPLVIFDPALLTRSAAGSQLLAALPSWADKTYEADERVLSAAAQTETPAGVVAVLRRQEPPPLSSLRSALGLILDRIADPGNAGTILRTADAAGAGYVVSLPGSVDLYAPKVVRSGMGAHFRLPVYSSVPFAVVRAALPDTTLVGLDAGAADSMYHFRWPHVGALVVGSEGHGLDPEVEAAMDHWVRIPMRPGVESLNAAVSASIALYAALGPGLG